jgi:DNA-binding XRE family transcriptional regulator/predicted RNase H-like HicB family nuclease
MTPWKGGAMLYRAIVSNEGKHTMAEFPDCPGCQTFATAGEDIDVMAAEALAGWLAVGLEDGEVPPRPSTGPRAPADVRIHWIGVPPRLAAALALRWARNEVGLTQAELAARVGVTQQAVAKLEREEGNPTLATLERVARALGMRVELGLEQVRSSRPSGAIGRPGGPSA